MYSSYLNVGVYANYVLKTYFIFGLFVVYTEAGEIQVSEWKTRIDLDPGMFRDVLFTKTQIFRARCAAICALHQNCFYFGFSSTTQTCKGLQNGITVTHSASNFTIYEKKCRPGFERYYTSFLCIKSKVRMLNLLSSEYAIETCSTDNARLIELYTEKEFKIAKKFMNARAIVSMVVGGHKVNEQWYWRSGEVVEKSSEVWTDILVNTAGAECLMMWKNLLTFKIRLNDNRCSAASFQSYICEEVTNS